MFGWLGTIHFNDGEDEDPLLGEDYAPAEWAWATPNAGHHLYLPGHDRLPDLLADGPTAREQLLAFATSSHARCGARSPARAFTSLSPAATSPLWDWCLTLTEVTFGICVEATSIVGRDDGTGSTYGTYTRMGVSAALNSLTWIERPLKCRGDSSCDNDDVAVWYRGAAGIDHVIVGRYRAWNDRRHWFADLGANSWRRLTGGPAKFRPLVQGGNGRWCLLDVGDDCGGVQCGCIAFPGEFVRCEGLFFNMVDPCQKDEAVVAFVDSNRDTVLVVIDVAKTYKSNVPVVLSRIKCHQLHEHHFCSGVLMRTTAGKRVIFVEALQGSVGSEFKFVEGCESNRSAGKAFSVDTEAVSQLSSSLLCISKTNTVEIWDCNSESTEPLWVVNRIVRPEAHYLPVIAASGFLFHQRVVEDGELKVTDSRGNVVVTLRWPPGICPVGSDGAFSVSGFS
ncbi:hypothetical protein Pelo_14895 [Pelomyxa schiedti]|nr:hypothetical protein Pelo_14895 [Pelomyxa schiedti]